MTNRKSKITAKVIQLILLIILIYFIFVLISRIRDLDNNHSQNIHLKTAETNILLNSLPKITFSEINII